MSRAKLLFVLAASAFTLGWMVVLWRMAPSVTTPAAHEASGATAAEPTRPEEPTAPATIALNLLLVVGFFMLAEDDPTFLVVVGGYVVYRELRLHPRKVVVGLLALAALLLTSYLLVLNHPVQARWLSAICWLAGLVLYTVEFLRLKTTHRRLMLVFALGALLVWKLLLAPFHAALMLAFALLPPAVHLAIHRKY